MTFLSWLGTILLVIWLLGLILKFAGALVHIILVVAAIVFIIDWLNRKKA